MAKRFARFGKSPIGKRLERIKLSKNFSNGKFQNINYTPQLTEGFGYKHILYDFLFKKVKNKIPSLVLPSVKTDLLNLPIDENVLVRFGHSSYFIQLDGKKFLVDPVFSGNASPIAGTMKAFKGSDIYAVDDLPAIDYLIITHDHYDHVDYDTIMKLKSKVGTIVCGLGVGEYFEYWGFDPKSVIETDRYETVDLGDGFTIYTAPARHFSGRGIIRNNTLWQSYVLQSPSMKIYIGGDSGYDMHFAEIGKQYGPFDLVILDNGQYDPKWKYIHMLPEEVLQAAKDLNAKYLLPVHSSKFPLAAHAWDDPLIKISELNKGGIPLVTPMIGEKVDLKKLDGEYKQWRVGLE